MQTKLKNVAPRRPKIQRCSEDRELNQARSKPDTVDRPVRTARTFVHRYNIHKTAAQLTATGMNISLRTWQHNLHNVRVTTLQTTWNSASSKQLYNSRGYTPFSQTTSKIPRLSLTKPTPWLSVTFTDFPGKWEVHWICMTSLPRGMTAYWALEALLRLHSTDGVTTLQTMWNSLTVHGTPAHV